MEAVRSVADRMKARPGQERENTGRAFFVFDCQCDNLLGSPCVRMISRANGLLRYNRAKYVQSHRNYRSFARRLGE